MNGPDFSLNDNTLHSSYLAILFLREPVKFKKFMVDLRILFLIFLKKNCTQITKSTFLKQYKKIRIRFIIKIIGLLIFSSMLTYVKQ